MVTATKVGRYEILGELGRGGMGVVYKAKDPVIGRTVAVKTIRLSEEGSGMSHKDLVQRFQTEARAAGLLTHPNIVVVYDAGEESGLYYITMELINGNSLQSRIDAGQRFRFTTVMRIMEQVCSALQYAHERNVVHRDIKPANVMMNADDTVKITDFGTAKILQYGGVQQTAVMGTPGYMSPEQIKGKAIDGRSDIFSLGVMLYELLTGRKPFPGRDIANVFYKILNEEPATPQSVDPTVPTGVNDVIMRALAKDPAQRYSSCKALMDNLRNYRVESPAANPTIPASPLPTRAASAPAEADAAKKSFATDMPKIPGVREPKIPGVYEEKPPRKDLVGSRVTALGLGIAAAVTLGFFGLRALIGHKQADPVRAETIAEHAASPEAGAAPAAPELSLTNSEIAAVTELSAPWSWKEFRFRDQSTSAYVSAIIVRLPGPPQQSSSYWAFSVKVPFSQCQYEYVEDLDKLAAEYKMQARHPMVGNPCSHAVFDPMQLKELPGGVLVRGAIVQGWDTRPPYGVELKVSGNRIQALRVE